MLRPFSESDYTLRKVVMPVMCLHFRGRLEKSESLLGLLALTVLWNYEEDEF